MNLFQNKYQSEMSRCKTVHNRLYLLQILMRSVILLLLILCFVFSYLKNNLQISYAEHPRPTAIPTPIPILDLGGLNPGGGSSGVAFLPIPRPRGLVLLCPLFRSEKDFWVANTTVIDLREYKPRLNDNSTSIRASTRDSVLSIVRCTGMSVPESVSLVSLVTPFPLSEHIATLPEVLMSSTPQPTTTPTPDIVATISENTLIELLAPSSNLSPILTPLNLQPLTSTITLTRIQPSILDNLIDETSQQGIILQPIDPNIILPPETEFNVTLTKPDGEVITLRENASTDPSWSFNFNSNETETGEYLVKVTSGDCMTECTELFSQTISVIGKTKITLNTPNDNIANESSVQDFLPPINVENGSFANHFLSPLDVEIEYQNFERNTPVKAGLYRMVKTFRSTLRAFSPDIGTLVLPEKVMLLPISTQEFQVTSQDSFNQSLESLLSVEDRDLAIGDYVILACYSIECDDLPLVQFGYVNEFYTTWPDFYYTSFRIAPPSLAGSIRPIQAQDRPIETGRNTTEPIVQTDLVFQVKPPILGIEANQIISASLSIRDSRGVEVHRRQESMPDYCAFGGDSLCEAWEFGHNGNRWPSGKSIQSGIHTLHATIYTQDGIDRTIGQTIRIELPELEANIIQTGSGSASSLVPDRLVFQLEAYDPGQGYSDGIGIERVELSVIDPDGEVIEEGILSKAPYCLHLDDENRCSAGDTLAPGFYALRAVITAEDGRVKQIQKSVQINPAVSTPLQTARAFYELIDEGVITGNYRPVYNLLSNARQERDEFSSFEAGFATTRAVKVELIELISQDEERAQVHIVIIATDEDDNGLSSVRYDIDYQLIFEDGIWRLDTAQVTPL